MGIAALIVPCGCHPSYGPINKVVEVARIAKEMERIGKELEIAASQFLGLKPEVRG